MFLVKIAQKTVLAFQISDVSKVILEDFCWNFVSKKLKNFSSKTGVTFLHEAEICLMNKYKKL